MVGGKHRQGDLDVVVQALGEQRPDGPVRQPGGQDAVLSGAALPAEEASRNLAGGVETLLVVHGQGEEVDVLGPGPAGHHGRRQDDGLAVGDSHTAVGLVSQSPCLDGKGFAADLALDRRGGR